MSYFSIHKRVRVKPSVCAIMNFRKKESILNHGDAQSKRFTSQWTEFAIYVVAGTEEQDSTIYFRSTFHTEIHVPERNALKVGKTKSQIVNKIKERKAHRSIAMAPDHASSIPRHPLQRRQRRPLRIWVELVPHNP